MILSFRCCTQLAVQIALLGFPSDAPLASGEPPNENGVERLPLSVESVDRSPTRPLSTSVKWDGGEYDVESGIDVLMGVVRNSEKSPDERHYALMRLVMLDSQLKGRPSVDQLARLYDDAGDLKAGVLLCLMASDDPRGIPVFIRTLDKEQNAKLRLRAAGALAQWNIRRGVAELVDLLESKEKLLLPGGLMPYVRDKAVDLFRTKNRLKGWGFPDEQIRESIETQLRIDSKEFERLELKDEETRKSIETRERLLREEFLALYNGEIKKWFEQNKHRFPDWKPGDPLPEVPQEEGKKTGQE